MKLKDFFNRSKKLGRDVPNQPFGTLPLHDDYAIRLYNYKKQYEDQYQLYEGLQLTHDRGKSIGIIKNTFSNTIDISYDKNKNDLNIQLHKRSIVDVQKLLLLIDNLGWYAAEIQIDGQPFKGNNQDAIKTLLNHNFEMAGIILNAKYDIEVDAPHYLYHASPQKYVEKILRIGLVPKSKSVLMYHPDRIYFATTEATVETMAHDMGVRTKIDEWSVLEIDTHKIPAVKFAGDSYFRVFIDPNYHAGGLYTLNNIPPIAIKHIKNIQV